MSRVTMNLAEAAFPFNTEPALERQGNRVVLREHPALPTKLRRQLGALFVDNFFRGASLAGRCLPVSHPRLHGVEVIRDVPYCGSGLPERRLDIYRPTGKPGPWPIVFYTHGGGFRILSKDSHWLFGLMFARAGYLVVNVNYRLAPRAPFPSALMDVCAAYEWLVRNADVHGGDVSRMALAGESAGANLATALTVVNCFPRPERWARRLFELQTPPAAVLPASGYLQVSDPERFLRQPRPPSLFLQDRLAEVTDAYLGGLEVAERSELELADPLLILEGAAEPARPLPPFFASCGTDDPLVDDTLRLKAALDARGVPCESRIYEGGMHAFHAFLFRSKARQYWRDAYRFLADAHGRTRAPAEARRERPCHVRAPSVSYGGPRVGRTEKPGAAPIPVETLLG